MRYLFALLSLVLCSASIARAADAKPVHGLFGLSTNQPPFKDQTPEKIAEMLSGWGVNAVWNVQGDEALVDALHEKGIKSYATVAFFYGWGDKGRPVTQSGKPMEPYAPNHWYQGTCPTEEGAIQRGLDAITQIATTTKVDGVWIDAVAYPIYWETPDPHLDNTCFCDRCLGLFQKETKIEIPADKADAAAKAEWIVKNHADEWTKWKVARITDLVKRGKEALQAAKPGATFGMFTVPWPPEEREHAATRIVGQDLAQLAKYVDVFSPMTYHRMCGHGEDTSWITKVSESVAKQTSKPVWPIIQAHSEPDCAWNKYTMTPEEFGKALAAGLAPPSGGGGGGVIVFTTDAMIGANYVDTAKTAFGGK